LDRQNTSDEEDRSVRVLKNWNQIPAIAKVNIRMPLNSDTLSSENSPELTNFWYDGYYYIFSIKHMFDGGEFTQKLDMLSMPQNTIFDPLAEAPVNDTGDTDNNTATSDEEDATTVPQAKQTRYARRQNRREESASARAAAEQVERSKQAPRSSNGTRRRRNRSGGNDG
jgi:hypothetical protein